MTENGVTLAEVARKVCTRCKESKTLNGFYRNARMADGLRHDCIDCTKDLNQAYRKKRKAREYQREYQMRRRTTDKPEAKPAQTDRVMQIALNAGEVTIAYKHPMTDADFNILIRSLTLNVDGMTGKL